MRQLSLSARWAAVIAVTVAASTGCMSIGDDGGKPSSKPSPDPKGSAAGPDGDTVSGTGGYRAGGGRAEAHSEREAAETTRPSGSATPSGSPDAHPRTERGKPGVPSEPGVPAPEWGGGQPVPEVSPPGSEVPQRPEPSPPPSESPAPEPPVSPEPEPSEPAPQPSASSAAELRAYAMSLPDEPTALRTPEVSPQDEPM
ncbi:hypothetical protein [Streptomyces sp. NPDC052042]|uniref:hypothetical protein n=1 Tax=Streptomyces sp. NPDC052042 TaxID=3365683 RepID=UPI0037D5806E